MGQQAACDLVLEGGVTSAVIYTGLIARLSRHYQLKSLGGTSSGAVAAAAGAIAQRAKLQAGGAGASDLHPSFKLLRDFPRALAKVDGAGQTVLFRLFQPQAATRRGYLIVATLLRRWDADRLPSAFARTVAAIFEYFPIAAILGSLPGLLVLFLSLQPLWQRGEFGLANAAGGLLGIVLTVLLSLAVAAFSALSSTLRGLLRNHYGLCSGMEGADASEVAPLTPTLHALFNALAGREPTDSPVVFEDLWGKTPGKREIDLQVITTALNTRRPYRLPNDPGIDPLRGFFYDPEEWATLFPKPVMAWLETHRRLPDGPALTSVSGAPLFALPEPARWPVLVAVRLSLSFPGLLSSVPMYTLERQPAKKRGASEEPFVASKVYFTDGGITSNCPVQLFDAPLPGHPTFGVRLDTFTRGAPGSHRIWLPDDTTEPPPRVRPFLRDNRWIAAFDFVAGIVDTAREWRDRLQRSLPGYRERIVVVGLEPGEGGLNLAMTPDTIARLSALGSRAALRLQHSFEGTRIGGGVNAWDRHRWLRLRSMLSAAQTYIGEVRNVAVPGGEDYSRMLDRRPQVEPAMADGSATAQAKALLVGLATVSKGDPEFPARDLGDNASQPVPRLRMSPPW